MDADHLLLGDREQGQGIALAQVFHGGQGQPGQIVQGQGLAGLVAHGGQAFAVNRGTGEGVPDGPVEALGLPGGQGFVGKIGEETVRGHGKAPGWRDRWGVLPENRDKENARAHDKCPGEPMEHIGLRKKAAPMSTANTMLRRLTAMT